MSKIIDFPTKNKEITDEVGPSITVHLDGNNELDCIDLFAMEPNARAVKALLEQALKNITEDTEITVLDDEGGPL